MDHSLRQHAWDLPNCQCYERQKKKKFFFKGMGRTILEKKTKKLNSQIQREVLDWIMDKQNHQC